jgi:hypothetical protein
MTILQPFQLKRYFTKDQEKAMEKDLVGYFTGKAKIGLYTIVTESPGRKTDYRVGFIVEQPDNPRPFIIVVVIEEKNRISKEKFLKMADQIAERADKLPERKKALIKNLQSIFN